MASLRLPLDTDAKEETPTLKETHSGRWLHSCGQGKLPVGKTNEQTLGKMRDTLININ